MKLLILPVCLFGPIIAHAISLKDFKQVTPYQTQAQRECANNDSYNWAVSIENTELAIKEYKEIPEQTLQVGSAKFIATNQGEWGGSLKVVDHGKSETLVNTNVNSIYKISDTFIVALGGVAHMGIDEGHMWLIKNNNGIWKIEKSIDLKANPWAGAIKSNIEVLLVTSNGIYSYRLDEGKLSKLADSDFLMLYPNSITVTPDGTTFVGMRHAVAKFTPQKGKLKEEWLTLKPCGKK